MLRPVLPPEWEALPIAERLARAHVLATDALARKGYRDAIGLLANWR